MYVTIILPYAKALKAGSEIFSDYNDPTGLINALRTGLLTEEDPHPAVRALPFLMDYS